MKTSNKKPKKFKKAKEPTIHHGEPWYGFNHLAVEAKHPTAKFVAEIAHGPNNATIAVYHQTEYRKDLGHKEYFGLFRDRGQWFITGFTQSQMEKEAIHPGVMCGTCNYVVYSKNQHDCASCPCGDTFIDGGKGPIGRSGGNPIKSFEVNLLTGELKDCG